MGNADGAVGIFGNSGRVWATALRPIPPKKRPCGILARKVGRSTNTPVPIILVTNWFRTGPLQVLGSTLTGRVVGTQFGQSVSRCLGIFLRPLGAFPPGFYSLRGVRVNRPVPEALLIRGMPTTKAFDSIHRGKMEQILLAYGLPKETVAAIMILYRNTKVKVRSPDGDTEYFDIVAGVLQGDTLAPYLFIICLDYVLRTSIDKIRENGFELTKRRSKRYPAKTITDADYADDLALLANTPNQAETLLHSLERAAAGIGLHVNANKTEYMCYNQTGNIATLDGASLKLVDKFTYLGSSVSSTEKDIDTRLTKAWTAIDRLSIIWKSDLTDKMKRSFFQAAVVSILLYGCTTWTLTKRLERRLDGNYTRMLRAVLNKSWRQHPTRLQLYGHLPPIKKTIQVRRTRHAGHCWRSKDELISDVLLWTPTHGFASVGRPARTYIQQLCEDTGCNPEDLPEAMSDREKWRETVRDIRAGGATWWWWWLLTVSLL